MTSSSPVAPAAGELLRERDRVASRLRSMALDAIPRASVLTVAQGLADLAADARLDPAQDERRAVPALAPHAAGDQLAVLVDEVAALIPTRPGPAGAELAVAATALLADLRRAL
jgi:hypothetical protein